MDTVVTALTTQGAPNATRINRVPMIGPAGRATYRALFVAAAAAVRSDGSTMAAMYACRVGTSICDSANRPSRMTMAAPSVGANGTSMSSTFDGRCVKTIVFTSPMRRSTQAADRADAPASKFAPKKMAPMVAGSTPKCR